MKKPYPTWVCQECGEKASKKGQRSLSCWHEGKCDVCGQKRDVTQPRDFYYPEFKQLNKKEV